jgi:hypothetical protein
MFAGSNFAGLNIKMENGVLKAQGVLTPATASLTGSIQVEGGISANARSWFNGLTTTSLYATNAIARNPTISIDAEFTLTENMLGVNQFIVFQNNRNDAKYTVSIVNPFSVSEQSVRIFNNSNLQNILLCQANGKFINKGDGSSGLIFNPSVSFVIVSVGLNWVVFNG